MIPRSPSPLVQRRERKHSVSSRSSKSSDLKHRRKIESPLPDYRPIDPFDAAEYERKRRKKEKKHKKDKKLKKKKKKLKHRSRSTSADSAESISTPPRKLLKFLATREEPLSDWEPSQDPPIRPEDVAKIDTTACSPVSNDSHIASSEPFEEKSRTPSPKGTPPKSEARESPHTPPIKNKLINNTSPIEVIDVLDADSSISPTPLEVPSRSISRQSYSPMKISPHRNPTPEVSHSYSHGGGSPRRRRSDRDMSHHRRHRKEKEKMKERRRSRSRSPVRRRMSRSPSWNRRHYSRSPSRNKISKR